MKRALFFIIAVLAVSALARAAYLDSLNTGVLVSSFTGVATRSLYLYDLSDFARNNTAGSCLLYASTRTFVIPFADIFTEELDSSYTYPMAGWYMMHAATRAVSGTGATAEEVWGYTDRNLTGGVTNYALLATVQSALTAQGYTAARAGTLFMPHLGRYRSASARPIMML